MINKTNNDLVVVLPVCEALLGGGMLVLAWWMTAHVGLVPCGLCEVQRVLVGFGGVIALTRSTTLPRWEQQLGAWAVQVALVGLGAALVVHHVHVQHQPVTTEAACLPGLRSLLAMMPWQEALRSWLATGGGCQDVQALWWGMSIPAWLGVAYVGLASLLAWDGWWLWGRRKP